MANVGLGSVDALTVALEDLLKKAEEIKPDGGIEPALTSTSFNGDVEAITKRAEGGILTNPQDHYAALETACRNIFYQLLASNSIRDSAFGQLWNLLDIIAILSDVPLCEPGLVFWLVEELLDSQTIDGCRVVFDYLDSRRERLTAKHFKQKQLIILRACNELLRRLSRAEDTVFCGRVFIFMFQSFPLGDRSSVNLRGEYHVENVTVFEKGSEQPTKLADDMEVDQKQDSVEKEKTPSQEPDPRETKIESEQGSQQLMETTTKSVKFDSTGEKEQESEPEPDTETLYPTFWALQDVFSQPTRLFEKEYLSTFKSSLDLTLRKFKAIQQQQHSRGTSKAPFETQRPLKRKRADSEGSDPQQVDLASSFNPRYLTSRDLFDLELSDLAFRRHILVQALILVDFLLSLTAKAKKKLEQTSNKSVLYTYTLPDEEVPWASAMRNEIATYLQQGQEGKFYYRMVDTVLSRDKNWVHWKAEGCPLIKQPPISAESFIESQKGAQKASQSKRLKPTPMGSLDLAFLLNSGDEGQAQGLVTLKKKVRYELPKMEDYKDPIAEDDFNIGMAKNEAEKEEAAVAKASKTWRALRIASKSRLNAFDKIEDGNNLGPLFDPPPLPSEKNDENDQPRKPDTEESKETEVPKKDEFDGVGEPGENDPPEKPDSKAIQDAEDPKKEEVNGVEEPVIMESTPVAVEVT
ncbi:MAG: hypothetical protein Q9174_002863 [Haloplaca sp. 1 TL-2023]